MAEREVGRVSALWRYPVKSMAAEDLQSVEELSASIGLPLTASRFRPNVVVDSPGSGSFPENGWIGSVLRIGGLRFRVDQRDKRCVMVNIDPSALSIDARVLRAIARERDSRFGVYGAVVEPG